jgi:hypothetical protein
MFNNFYHSSANSLFNIEYTSFIQGLTSLPHINVQCPALYTLKNYLTSGLSESQR